MKRIDSYSIGEIMSKRKPNPWKRSIYVKLPFAELTINTPNGIALTLDQSKMLDLSLRASLGLESFGGRVLDEVSEKATGAV